MLGEIFDQFKEGIKSFRGYGFRSNTSQTESTSNDIEFGNRSTRGKGQKNKRDRESAKEAAASPLSSSKKAKHETA